MNFADVTGKILKEDASVGEFYFNGGSLNIKAPDEFFVIAGQSNAHGQGTIDTGIDVGGSNIFQINSSDMIELAVDPLANNTHIDNDKMGYGVAFAREYIANNSNKTIMLILCAKSGTSFNGGHWKPTGDQYKDMIKAINKAKDLGSVFKGVLWHQGESDSTATASPLYEQNLIDFVDNWRADTNSPLVPFACGTLADDYLANTDTTFPNANRNEVNDAILKTPQIIDYANFVDLSGLGTSDNLHFNASALRTAGVRYYNALVSSDALTVKTPLQSWSSLKAYQLDGTNERFTGPLGSTLGLSSSSSFTISLALNFDMSRTKTCYLFSLFNGSEKIEIQWTNSQIRFYVGTTYVYASPSRSLKNYHIACVFDGSLTGNTNRAKIYIDGTNLSTDGGGTIPSSSPSFTSSYLCIGDRYSGVAAFDEKVVECNVWDNPLTSTSVSALYNSGGYSDPLLISGCIASWWFGDNSNDTNLVVNDNASSFDLVPVNIENGDIVTL